MPHAHGSWISEPTCESRVWDGVVINLTAAGLLQRKSSDSQASQLLGQSPASSKSDQISSLSLTVSSWRASRGFCLAWLMPTSNWELA